MTEQPNPYSQPESSELPIVEARKPTSKRKLWFWLAMGGCVFPLALIGLAVVVFIVFYIFNADYVNSV